MDENERILLDPVKEIQGAAAMFLLRQGLPASPQLLHTLLQSWNAQAGTAEKSVCRQALDIMSKKLD